MLKTYRGSCHCGSVRFECEVDLAQGTRRCNCRFCGKSRLWKVFVLGDAFRIVSGQEMLRDYRGPESQWPQGHVHHYFCGHCGFRGFSKGYLEMEPFDGWFHAVNVAALDGVSDEELAAIPIQYENGREDDYDHPPAVVSHM
ncbi:GFA family protein [Mesorhizobium sp. 8]|nr:GFA family protein [Mesorhizobium sp. 8]